MKNLIKQQYKEFDILLDKYRDYIESYRVENIYVEESLIEFISKVRKETAEYVFDKIEKRLQPKISKKHAINAGSDAGFGYTAGYNDRIIEEKEIRQDILQDFNIGGKQNETRTQRSADISE